MIQKLKAALDADDRAVSPVIGVILMVAITVILAAVIASLTLGLGDSAQTAPTAKIDASQETISLEDAAGDTLNAKVVTLSHQSGATLDAERISVTVNGEAAYSVVDQGASTNDDISAFWGSGEITAGSSARLAFYDTDDSNDVADLTAPAGYTGAVAYSDTDSDGDADVDISTVDGEMDLESGDTIRVVWTSEDGGSSSTIYEYTVE